MEIAVCTDLGIAELQLETDRERHTLAELAARVADVTPATVIADGRVFPADVTLSEAGIRRGSVVDLRTGRRTAPPAGRLLQVAGRGAGTSVDLPEGTHRLGPSRHPHSLHLSAGPVARPAVMLHVEGQLVEVEPGHDTATLAGRLLTTRRAWTDGDLVVAGRVFTRVRRHQAAESAAATTTTTGEEHRHLDPIPVGRSLRSDSTPYLVTADATGGIGVVAQPDDAAGILRSIVLELADRSWPHGTALGIRSSRPERWEWTKWLDAVDTPGATGPTPIRHVVLVDDGSLPDTRERAVAVHVPLIVARHADDQLPGGLATIIRTNKSPGDPTSFAVTSGPAGPSHPHVAPILLGLDAATARARAIARRRSVADDDRVRAFGELRVRPWVVDRRPTALERRTEQRCAALRRPVTALHESPSDTASAASDESGDRADEDLANLVGAAGIDPSRIVLPLGWWTQRDSVATVPLPTGRRMAVVGPPGSGRSSFLALFAEASGRLAEGLSVFAVAPFGGPLVDPERVRRVGIDVAADAEAVAGWIQRIRRSERPLVLVDDADHVGGPSFEVWATDRLDHATLVFSSTEVPPAGHWTAPTKAPQLQIRLDTAPGYGVLHAERRPRPFRTVGLDRHDAAVGRRPDAQAPSEAWS